MIPRISHVEPLPDCMLYVVFDDGKKVIYDVKDDVRRIRFYRPLVEETGLFQQVQLSESRTRVFWTDAIDLPSDDIYDLGKPI